MIVGSLAFQVFAMEVRRCDPALFDRALSVAEDQVCEAMKEDAAIADQLQVIEAIRGLADVLGQMKTPR